MQLSAIALATLADPLVLIAAVLVYFKRTELKHCLMIAAGIAFLGFTIQFAFGVAFDAGFAIVHYSIKFVSCRVLLCAISYFRNRSKKE